MEKPSILLYGHLCIDRNEIAGKQIADSPGSPAYFGTKIFQNLGADAMIIANRGTDYPNTWITNMAIFPPRPITQQTLVYKNVYDAKGTRTLFVEHLDTALPVNPEIIPTNLIQSISVVVICPIVNNIQISIVADLKKRMKKDTVLVCLPQGFFRRFKSNGAVYQSTWEQAESFVQYFDIICLSEEDGENIDAQAERWSKIKPIVAVTRAEKGCSIYERGKRTNYPAIKVEKIVDPVGAGDVFAASFVYNYLHNTNTKEAASFANLQAAHWIQQLH